MDLQCPQCGSRDLRYSHLRTPGERLASLVGVRPVRCRGCRARFSWRLWKFSDLRYARCPKCLRMDLGIWPESHYRLPTFRSILLQLGANPYRCEYCRYNFVSFRRRKERFSFHRWKKERDEVTRAAATPVPEQMPPAED